MYPCACILIAALVFFYSLSASSLCGRDCIIAIAVVVLVVFLALVCVAIITLCLNRFRNKGRVDEGIVSQHVL